MSHNPIPDVPGVIVEGEKLEELRNRVKTLLKLNSLRFPGAQPVSFVRSHLLELEKENYFVAEKSDGARCLCFMTTQADGRPRVYLIDRKNFFHEVDHMRFPHPGDATFSKHFNNTLVDGEIVMDRGAAKPRFLLFDCLCIAGKYICDRDLMKRLGYLKEHILKPHAEMALARAEYVATQPFTIEFKEQQFAYNLSAIFNEIIPKLKHGNDGLIFTCVSKPYILGTCEGMLKWKPAEENSIDFKLRIEWPTGPRRADIKPKFLLYAWVGHQGNRHDEYDYWGEMGVTWEEFEEFKTQYRPEELDNRIVEVVRDDYRTEKFGISPWKMLRFRNDKENGNHISIVKKVVQSIRDAVGRDELISQEGKIRSAWELRKAAGGPSASSAVTPLTEGARTPARTPVRNGSEMSSIATNGNDSAANGFGTTSNWNEHRSLERDDTMTSPGLEDAEEGEVLDSESESREKRRRVEL